MSIYRNKNLRERRILGYNEVAAVPAGTVEEPLVDVRTYDPSIRAEYLKSDMQDIAGDMIYVRDMLAEKLANVNAELAKQSFRLWVVYGYRHPDVQNRYFMTQRAVVRDTNPDVSEEELDGLTHNFVAVPEIGGHPAAAAVDLTIVDKDNEPLDMGTAIADYSDPEKIRTDHPGLTRLQIGNRALLHDAMVEENFAPFYGEWWHFSYGDREWGAFYDVPALYGQVDFKPSQA